MRSVRVVDLDGRVVERCIWSAGSAGEELGVELVLVVG